MLRDDMKVFETREQAMRREHANAITVIDMKVAKLRAEIVDLLEGQAEHFAVLRGLGEVTE